MIRTARVVSLVGLVAGLIAPLAVAVSQAQKERTPTVAILAFTNGSSGKDARDYDGLSKGIPAMLITDMSANPNIRVIERDQVQALVDEQKLVTGGHVDQTTAVKIGKLLGAHHMIWGTYMTDPRGNFRIDARAVNVESGIIEHVERIDDKADNIMNTIGTLASAFNTGMHLPAMAELRMTPAAGAQPAVTPSPTPKLPMRVAVMYGKALDLKDRGEKGKAVELFDAVLKEFPNYEPAAKEKASLGKGS